MAKKKTTKKKAPGKKAASKKITKQVNKKTTPIGWTQKELAESVGCSRQYIGKLIKKGIIPKLKNSKIDETKAIDIYFAHHAEVGKEDLRKYNKSQKGQPKKAAGKKKKTEEEGTDVSSRAVAIANAFNTAKVKEKEFNAMIKELEYKKLKRELIPIEEVIRDATRTISLLKSHLTSLPSRLAPKMLQRESIPEIQDIIFHEINELLKDFQESKFNQGDDDDGDKVDDNS